MAWCFIITIFHSCFYTYNIIISYLDEPTTRTCNATTRKKDSDSEEQDVIPEEIIREVEDFENKHKSNPDKNEIVNLEDSETIKETRISIHC